jgi:hypothetical protein
VIVEFTGPTGAGKSSCLERTLSSLASFGVSAGVIGHTDKSVEGIPRAFASLDGHNWRTDIAALPWAVALLLANPRYAWFVLRAIFAARAHRLAIARAVMRKLGIHRFLSQSRFRDTVVLVDEGILHVSHNILVPLVDVGSADVYATFTRLTPLPAIAVFLVAPPENLLCRLRSRGDLSPRIRSGDDHGHDFDHFVRDAAHLFSVIPTLLERRVPRIHIDTTTTENDEIGFAVAEMIRKMLPVRVRTSTLQPSGDQPTGPEIPQSNDPR